MGSINPSKRLKALASLVKKGSRVADIGSDHGFLAMYLVERGIADEVLAVENKEGPYSRLRREIISNGYESEIKTSLSDGISSLGPGIDTVVIAGMGGSLIRRIIESHEEKLPSIEAFVIDPHSEAETIYRYLASKGYREDESIGLIEHGIYYSVSRWVKGEGRYSDAEFRYGPLDVRRRDPSLVKRLKREVVRLKAIESNGSVPEEKRKELRASIGEMEEIIDED